MSNRSIIVTTSLITFLLTSALWIGVLLFAHWSATSNPPAFQVEIDAPNEVFLDQEFELVVSVTNASDSDITLGSLDVYESLIEGFEVISIEPTPNETVEMMGLRSDYFFHRLSAHEKFAATYALKAKKEGLWIGDIDSCTPFENFVTVSKAIRVKSK